VALLPKLTCPACWPAYAGALSALGWALSITRPFLLPLTVLFLLVSVCSLFFAVQRHRHGEPLALGVAGAAIVVAAKFAWDSDTVMFGGLAILVGASFWNTWLAGKPAVPLATMAPAKKPLTLHQGAGRRFERKGGERNERDTKN
jgi:mercuric ion transport protein